MTDATKDRIFIPLTELQIETMKTYGHKLLEDVPLTLEERGDDVVAVVGRKDTIWPVTSAMMDLSRGLEILDMDDLAESIETFTRELGTLDAERNRREQMANALELRKREGSCSTEDFWDVVEELAWDTRAREERRPRYCERVAAGICNSWTAEFFDEFLSKFRVHVDHLDGLLGDHSTLGDDGFADLRCHIVGAGKEAYDHAVSRPAEGVARFEGRHIESFSYCLHVNSVDGELSV